MLLARLSRRVGGVPRSLGFLVVRVVGVSGSAAGEVLQAGQDGLEQVRAGGGA